MTNNSTLAGVSFQSPVWAGCAVGRTRHSRVVYDRQFLCESVVEGIRTLYKRAAKESADHQALFSQDDWPSDQVVGAGSRDIVLRVRESESLNSGGPIKRIRGTLSWTKAIDLDPHAFYVTSDGDERHVYLGHKVVENMRLDADAGVGGCGGQNEENIIVTDLAGV